MILIAFFTDDGTPKTGLTPTIDVWKHDGTQVVTAQTMTEVAGGFYQYDFTTYDEALNYCIRADGGSGLAVNERYVFASNELGQVTEDLTFLQDIEGGRWKIENHQMIFYKSDNETEVCRFNLFDSYGTRASKNIMDRQRV